MLRRVPLVDAVLVATIVVGLTLATVLKHGPPTPHVVALGNHAPQAAAMAAEAKAAPRAPAAPVRVAPKPQPAAPRVVKRVTRATRGCVRTRRRCRS